MGSRALRNRSALDGHQDDGKLSKRHSDLHKCAGRGLAHGDHIRDSTHDQHIDAPRGAADPSGNLRDATYLRGCCCSIHNRHHAMTHHVRDVTHQPDDTDGTCRSSRSCSMHRPPILGNFFDVYLSDRSSYDPCSFCSSFSLLVLCHSGAYDYDDVVEDHQCLHGNGGGGSFCSMR